MRTYPILIVLHLLTIIFTSTQTSGEEHRGRMSRIRQKETTNNEEKAIKMQDNRDKRLIGNIVVKEKDKNKPIERTGTSQRRDNLVYKRTRDEAVTRQSLDGNKRNKRTKRYTLQTIKYQVKVRNIRVMKKQSRPHQI